MQQRMVKYAQRKHHWGDKNKSESAASPREIVLLSLLDEKYLVAWKTVTGLGIINQLNCMVLPSWIFAKINTGL